MSRRGTCRVAALSLPIATLLSGGVAGLAVAATAERLLLGGADAAQDLILRGAARVSAKDTGAELNLAKTAYAEWAPRQTPSSDAGTLSMWVKPLWQPADPESHTFATFRWSGADQSYFALSQGWWEPVGARKLYVVLSNQQYVFCFMPWAFDYTFYLPDQWTMLAVTWRAGNPGFLRLFVDGKAVCERSLPFAGGRHAVGPVYLGSDLGSTVEPLGRSSDALIKDVVLRPDASSAEELRSAYVRAGGSDRPKWIAALVTGGLPPPAGPPADVTHERRVMQDEDTGWAASKGEIQRRIKRIKAAGFNVYMPNVWDGAHAYYVAGAAPVAHTVRDPLNPAFDPLTYLTEVAHGAGIAVHPWFIVARNPGGSDLPESYAAGAPPGSFNVHSTEFRSFIVSLVTDVARRYAIDGINLDYIRAIGPCTSEECLAAYGKTYGRSLTQDWKSQEAGQVMPTVIDWNRAAITDIVSRISSGVRRLKPNAVLSIDTVPFDHSRQHQGLDEEHWLAAGLIDDLFDMSYEDPLDIDLLDRAMKAFAPARQVIVVRDYDIFDGTVVDRSGAVMEDYVKLIRTRWPGAGIGFYHYPHFSPEQLLRLGEGVFKPAAHPDWTH